MLLGLFALLCLSEVSASKSPGYFILAPNVFHLGEEETISVTVYDAEKPVKVQVCLLDYPNRQKTFACVQDSVAKDTPKLFSLKINPGDFPKDDDPGSARFAYLRALLSDAGFVKESKVSVSYKDGVILLHTDKPIYTPSQPVMIRVIPLSLQLKSSSKNVTLVVQNHQGIIVQKWKDLSTETGFITKVLQLSESAMLGNWTIIALYGHQNSQNASVKFEVKKYVLPTFSVTAEGPEYILVDHKSFTIKVRAKYTYGKPVKGSTNVKLSIVGGRVKAIPLSLKTKTLSNDGTAQFDIDVNEIKNHPLRPWFPEGRRLQIEADVIEQTTGKRESVIDNAIYFSKSPFLIHVDDTPKYFKPALPFVVKVYVTYPNQKPAPNIPVSISVTGKDKQGTEVPIQSDDAAHNVKPVYTDVTDKRGKADLIVDVPRGIESLKITIKTEKKDIPSYQNVDLVLDVSSYYSPSGNFLHLRQKKKHGKVGLTLEFEAYANTTTPLNYLVIARGKILFQRILTRKLGVVSTLRFPVTPAMSPAARLVAYYVIDGNEIVADSLLMDIQEEFPNKLQVAFHKGDGVSPSAIQVSATPGSRVGLLGVDQSVYLLRNRDKLNKKKAFKLFKALDLGCGVGAGADSEDVFDNAGVVVLSSSNLVSSGRSKSCTASAQRKKRSSGAAKDDLSKCCEMAKLPYRGRAGCDARARYMASTTSNCRLEFLRCCKIENNEKDSIDNVRGRVNIDEESEIEDQILNGQIRSYFPETWIFQEETVGKDGKYRLPVTLPETITTWVLQALAVSNQTGFGLAQPVNINTFKEFFVSLSLPYSVQRGEQVSVIATVYNYDKVDCKVQLYIAGSADFCSTSNPRENSKLVVMDIKANDAESVALPIVPIKLGQIDVTVFAGAVVSGQEGLSWLGSSDAVRRSILVVPEGVERRITHSLVLDPQGILRDETTDADNSSSPTAVKVESAVHNGEQMDHVMLSVPNTAIPGSIQASIYLTGNLIGPAVTNLIQGGLDTLLQMPMGCGEQTMMHLAPNVYVLQYLRNTKQVTVDIEAQAYKFIQSGYQRELNYRREDRSFSAFGESRPGSTWLTAFVVKVFCAAQKFDGIEVDEALICDSVSWLIENQRHDGAFPEVKNIIHTSMMGGVHGDVAMTAFVLISLLECECQDKNKDKPIKNAVRFLETELAVIEKPNALAIISYALAMAGSDQFSTANTKFWSKSTYGNDTGSSRYWRVGGPALNIETAAYGLLAQLAGGRLKSAGPIVKWLTEQRNSNGGFASTQDTCVALQALAKYSEKTAGSKLNLRVSLSSEMNAHWKRIYSITKDNAFIQRHEDITQLREGEIFIDSKGTGVGQMQIEIKYNVPSSKNETCEFDLSVRTREVKDSGASIFGKSRLPRDARKKKKSKCRRKNGKNSKKCRRDNKKKPQKEEKRQTEPPESLLIDICTRYLKPGKAGMSILDIGIFTGFTPDEESLEELKKNVRPTVDRFEFSDRAVVLYVSEVSNSSEFCISFKVKRVFEVGAVQPVPIKIYDYYEPENSCTKFYSPEKGSELLLGICNGEQCKCTQKGCTPCDIGLSKPHEIATKACKDYEFVILVEVYLVDEIEKSRQSWLTYFVVVKDVHKKGSSKFRKGAEFEFKKRAGCKCPDLKEGKQYMILGRDSRSLNVLDDKDFVMLWEKRKNNKAQLEDLRGKISKHPRCKGK